MSQAIKESQSAYFSGGLCFAHGPFEGDNCSLWPDCTTDRQKPEYIAMAHKLTEFEDINRQWVEKCKAALNACPNEFVPTFIEIMFMGARLMTETRIRAEMNTALGP